MSGNIFPIIDSVTSDHVFWPLSQALIERAEQQDYHALVGVIDATNQASIALHVRCGFGLVGTLPQVGFKFGGWLDAVLYQRILPSPAQPVDG